MMFSTCSYYVHQCTVLFGNQRIVEARWFDFQDLSDGYGQKRRSNKLKFHYFHSGKDGNHAFYMGKMIKDPVDVNTFQTIGNGYARDARHMFLYGQIIKHISFNDIQLNNSTQTASYETHRFQVFFLGKIVPTANWINFLDLGYGYGSRKFVKDYFHYYILLL